MPFACYRGETGQLETDANKLSSRWRYAEPFFDQTGTICLDRNVKSVFLGLLLMLQVLSIVWLLMIIKVVLSVFNGDSANDTRSSDEDEGEEREEEEENAEEEKEEEEEKNEKTSRENEECKEDGSISKSAHAIPNGKARASGNSDTPSSRQAGLFQRGPGIRVPGSRDRKELIGRVGCNG